MWDRTDYELSELASSIAGHDVKVIFTDDLPGADGIAEYDRIFINRNAPFTKTAFIFWHELSHIMLGHCHRHTDKRYKTSLHRYNREQPTQSIQWRGYNTAEQPIESAADTLTLSLVSKHQPAQLRNVQFYISQRG